MAEKNCLKHSGFKDQFGNEHYDLCEKPTKYRIKFKDPLSGKIKEEWVCGIHFRSIEKTLKRLDMDFIEQEAI